MLRDTLSNPTILSVQIKAMLQIQYFFRFTNALVIFACFPGACSLLRADDPAPPIRALLVVGGCCHDYEHQKDILTKGVSARANVAWQIAYDPDRGTRHLNPIYEQENWASNFDVIVHDECCSDVTDEKLMERILKPHRAGVPAVVLHCGMHSYRSKGYPDETTPWFEFTGLATTGHGPQVPIDVSILDHQHPVMAPLKDWTTIKEELYNNHTGQLLDTATALAKGRQIYRNQQGIEITDVAIVTWTNLYCEKTRVFATTLGHNTDTVADDRYLELVARGLLWSVDKLNEEYLRPAENHILSIQK